MIFGKSRIARDFLMYREFVRENDMKRSGVKMSEE